MSPTARTLLFSLLVAGVTAVSSAQAADQTRPVNLVAGWNSVWLEVSPIYSSGAEAGLPMRVEDVFGSNDVDIVASTVASAGTAEFVGDVSSGRFNQPGWAVWRSAGASELDVDTLVRVRGNRPYLVKANTNVVVNLTGEVGYHTPDWDPASYSLVGFSLSGSVTFDDFFQGSDGAHDVAKILALDPGGQWVGVSGTGAMASHEAYWIFSERDSDYMGPVSIDFGGADSLSFGRGPGTAEVPDPGGQPGDTLLVSLEEITFSNVDTTDRTLGLTKVDPPTTGGAAAGDDLRLYEIVPVPTNLNYIIGGTGQVTSNDFGAIASRTSRTLTLGAHRNWTTGDRARENLYRIEVGIGSGQVRYWLPVRATNADLLGGTELAADVGAAGLWIGSVRLNEVTSVTEPGGPLQPTTSVAPLRLLLHVNATGDVSLLSHVMIMQTKTADAEVSPETVLVVNEEKIPFFEGIEQRGGQKIGRRLESVAFDMPRKMDVLTQTNLVDEVLAADTNLTQVAESNLVQFVNSRDSRPPDLVEDYVFSWPLTGGLAGGGLVSTDLAAPLLLDPFHRSNPFRHAFHPQHGAGFPVERHIRIVLDEQADADLLTGIYEETLTGPGATVDGGTGRLVSSSPGLTAFSIVMRGPIALQRVSAVAELQD